MGKFDAPSITPQGDTVVNACTVDEVRRARLCVATHVPKDDVLTVLEALGIGAQPEIAIVP